MPGDDRPVLTSVSDGIAWIELNRPHRLNAFNNELMVSLLAFLESAMVDPGVRVVVITGAGRAFCAGGDVNALDETIGHGPLPEQAARLREVARIVQVLYEGPKPSIAAINGACAGAGLGLAAAADLRIAAQRAVFTTAFLGIGLSGDFGGAWTLSRLVGQARARQLYLECERIDAARALALGLVDAVVPGEDLAAEVRRRAQRIAGFSPQAVASVKANFRDAEALEFAAFLDKESLRQVQTQASPESKRAVQEFIAARSK